MREEKYKKWANFPDCIGHWGTNVGMIAQVRIKDIDGKEINYFSPEAKIYK